MTRIKFSWLGYPCTIARARYGGAYEGGEWVAFPLNVYALPDGWDASDVPCWVFWDSVASQIIGRGSTPNEAYADLVNRSECKECYKVSQDECSKHPRGPSNED